jgi:acetyltransferase-like isoleucine patch superfamily enzyme
MLAISNKLRSIPWIYQFVRSILMAYRRKRFGLRHVHPTFYMTRSCKVTRDLVAGEYSFLNIGCNVGQKVELGRYVMLGPYVSVVGNDHESSKPGVPIIFSGRPPQKQTVIDDDVWVGFGAIIMAGVRIGRGAIVGAGSVVTKTVPPYEIHAGVPAKKVGERFADEAERLRHDAMLNGPVVSGQLCSPID